MSTRTYGWRLALLASGVLLVAGGRLHPDADPSGTLREELAEMASDDRWVPGHLLVVASTVLLAVGLHAAVRSGDWPSQVRRRLGFAAAAVSLYVLETVVHLAAVVDVDVLRDGGTPVIAFTHVALSVVLYPLLGYAVAALGLSVLVCTSGARRALGALAVLAGVLQAVSVPFTLLLPDAESSPLFAGAAVLLALWSVLTGATGAPVAPAPPARSDSIRGWATPVTSSRS